MTIEMLKGKIHRATVVQAELDYVGSITVDEELLEAAGILEYSVDGAPFKKLDTFTAWSGGLYIPWVYMFDTELPMGKHRLTLRMSKDHHPQSKGTSCQIRQFVVNDSCE
mgnify:FL=1